jgi:hypothetical protein|tara:strand:- start:310 stop:564 length:255 start_codon:yes stop_codon:yes gene_type:complete
MDDALVPLATDLSRRAARAEDKHTQKKQPTNERTNERTRSTLASQSKAPSSDRSIGAPSARSSARVVRFFGIFMVAPRVVLEVV